MSENKTEKPTPKRLQDAARKGQVFRSKDVLTAILLLAGTLYLSSLFSLKSVTDLIVEAVKGPAALGLEAYALSVTLTTLKIAVPFIGLCVVASALPSLLFTRFRLATESLKLNWSAINPVSGFKKIFSMRTVKELVKAMLTLTLSLAGGWVFWLNEKRALFSGMNGDLVNLGALAGSLLRSLVFAILAALVIILIMDLLTEYLLFMKDMMMDKQEIKQEYKEQEGNPEVKSRRREIHMELLSAQDKSDIKNSQFLLTNPTHIAIGIFCNPEIIPVPFISFMANNQKALAARRYAEKIGIPVVKDIPLARKIFRTHHRYSFVSLETVEEIARILVWLQQVEMAGQWPPVAPPDIEPDEQVDTDPPGNEADTSPPASH
ncbi:EscU/YscU/HrcU family type III secretion system export apparatus switch protein [Paludibacterium paludis]|uniref:Type III secretion system protein SpaS n=1 Tax=Paludibacterium paludis TaxID=1225769 RepID=A0A918P615_9NEIS|nr:EscU/YscU/HrcU family type III secretion system export apparatus switch protein [Paludibacterium paludis]GGY23950.1 type III secretion system protein SpaS [Paludibacterium paludis]